MSMNIGNEIRGQQEVRGADSNLFNFKDKKGNSFNLSIAGENGGNGNRFSRGFQSGFSTDGSSINVFDNRFMGKRDCNTILEESEEKILGSNKRSFNSSENQNLGQLRNSDRNRFR